MPYWKSMTIFDANMILRYLLNDNEEMASEAEAHLQKDEVCVTVEIIAEVVYVLKGVYSLGRETICDTLKDFLGMLYCRDRDIVLAALDIYAEKNLDFVDCVLYAYNKIRKYEIATFDKQLLKLINNN